MGPDERIDMLDGGDALVLGDHGAGHGDQGLARGIRDEMKVEIAAAHETSFRDKESINVDRTLVSRGPGQGPVGSLANHQQG
jgi:hypothetical protein